MDFIPRHAAGRIDEALEDRPVVLLNGARQTGKSTLIKWICERKNVPYKTLDDLTILSSAKNDPAGFLSGIQCPVAIDEVQRVPEIFLAIKAVVDRKRMPGSFILTGSANAMVLPKISESLVGRIEIISLWPLSRGEMNGHKEKFIDAVFADTLSPFEDMRFDRIEFLKQWLIGGYPEVQRVRSSRRRTAWFQSYITTLLQRDVKDLSNIEGISELPRLLSMIAARSGALLNMSDLSRGLGLSNMTLKRYIALLQAVFVVHLLPPWSANIGKRLIKTPKAYLNDTGLLSFLLGADLGRLKGDPNMTGAILESMVMQELSKQRTWNDTAVSLFYYRTASGKEVDFILETLDGRIAGIEVKAASTVRTGDLKGLRDLAESAGQRFQRGVILYLGNRTVPFSKNIHAVPMPALWM